MANFAMDRAKHESRWLAPVGHEASHLDWLGKVGGERAPALANLAQAPWDWKKSEQARSGGDEYVKKQPNFTTLFGEEAEREYQGRDVIRDGNMNIEDKNK